MIFVENPIPYMAEDSKFHVGVPEGENFRLVSITEQWVEFVSSKEKILVHPDKAIDLLNKYIQLQRSMTFG